MKYILLLAVIINTILCKNIKRHPDGEVIFNLGECDDDTNIKSGVNTCTCKVPLTTFYTDKMYTDITCYNKNQLADITDCSAVYFMGPTSSNDDYKAFEVQEECKRILKIELWSTMSRTDNTGLWDDNWSTLLMNFITYDATEKRITFTKDIQTTQSQLTGLLIKITLQCAEGEVCLIIKSEGKRAYPLLNPFLTTLTSTTTTTIVTTLQPTKDTTMNNDDDDNDVKLPIILGVVAGVAIIVIVVLVICICKRRKSEDNKGKHANSTKPTKSIKKLDTPQTKVIMNQYATKYPDSALRDINAMDAHYEQIRDYQKFPNTTYEALDTTNSQKKPNADAKTNDNADHYLDLENYRKNDVSRTSSAEYIDFNGYIEQDLKKNDDAGYEISRQEIAKEKHDNVGDDNEPQYFDLEKEENK